MRAQDELKVLAVIPARFASTRFPGKIIAPLAGKPLVVHVFERARAARLVSDVLIATDDERVRDAVAPFGAKVVMTSAAHLSGTDRLAEVARQYDADIFVNVQGDEPLIEAEIVDAVVAPLLDEPALGMVTARRRLLESERLHDPNVVKVVCDAQHRALYFSRYPIPYVRDGAGERPDAGLHWQHIGIYAYRRAFLLQFAGAAPTSLEQAEKLEQLRALENGWPIHVIDTKYAGVGVDTPEDLERVSALLR